VSLKIMVVNDEPSSKLMKALSTPLGHTVLTFDDYVNARERAEMQRFDLVLVGGIAEMPGLELVRHVRNSPTNRSATIVMLGTSDDVACVRKSLGEGADVFLTKPLAADRMRRMLEAMDSREWKDRGGARLPLFTEVICAWDQHRVTLRSLNISEGGMLLQSTVDADLGQEIALEFKIAYVGASLRLSARIVRKEGTERVAVKFIAVAPEDRNAIQIYVMGRMKDLTPPRDLSGIGLPRIFRT
jgi:DNA-binding response OmpR family regulator